MRVIAVAANGPFGKTALQVGMILLSVNGQKCNNVDEAASLLRNAVDELTLVAKIDNDAIVVAVDAADDEVTALNAPTKNLKQQNSTINATIAATSAVGNNVAVELFQSEQQQEQRQRLLMQQSLMQQQHQLRQQQQLMLQMTTPKSSTALPPSSSSSSSSSLVASTSGPSQNYMHGECRATTNEPSPNDDTMPTTAIRVVDRATLTLETDLPYSSARELSSTTGGMLRVTLRTVMGRPSKATKALSMGSSRGSRLKQQPGTIMTDGEKKEHKRRLNKRYVAQKNMPFGIFIWMANNTVHNQETILRHLENEYGYDTTRGDDILFVPYSTKDKWCTKYPIAMPSLVMNEVGDIVNVALAVAAKEGHVTNSGRVRKRKVLRGPNALRGHSNLPDAERDELHIAMYDYLTWLRDKLVEADANPPDTKKNKKRKKADTTGNDDNVGDEGEGDDFGGEMKASVEVGNADENVNDSTMMKKKQTTRPTASREAGVNIIKLKTVMNAFEATFSVVHKYKFDKEAEMTKQNETRKCGEDLVGGGGEEDENGRVVMTGIEGSGAVATSSEIDEAVTTPTTSKPTTSKQTSPLLEETMTNVLHRLVNERGENISLGKSKRRGRKRMRTSSTVNNIDCDADDDDDDNGNEDGSHSTPKRPHRSRGHSRVPKDFDDMYERLVKFHQEFGTCLVKKSYEDKQLSGWVRNIREKRKLIRRTQGVEYEEISPDADLTQSAGKFGTWNGKGDRPAIFPMTLTAERISRLDAIGFDWAPAGNIIRHSWEDRFRELLDYYESNDGQWPPQSLGTLGEWVHKQRTKYQLKEEPFMTTKAHRVS